MCDVTDLEWAADGGVSAGGHDDSEPASGVHEYVLEVRAVHLRIHAGEFVVVERGLLPALNGCQEGTGAVEGVGDGQRQQPDVGRLPHQGRDHRRLHPPPGQHQHAEDVSDESEHAQCRVEDPGKDVLDGFEQRIADGCRVSISGRVGTSGRRNVSNRCVFTGGRREKVGKEVETDV